MLADYRAGQVWAAIINSQGGITEHEGAEAKAVRPQDAFPSLAEILDGDTDRDDTDALVAALKGMGARDMRSR